MVRTPTRFVWRARSAVRPLGARVRSWAESRPDRWASAVFLVVAVPVGLAFVFIIPPSQVLDERAHLLRAWQLAELNLVTDPRLDASTGFMRNGSVYDVCVFVYIDEFQELAATPRDFVTRSFWFDTPDCSPRHREYFITDAMTNYGPWSYPGQVVGLAASRLVGAPLPISFYAGRLFGLALYASVVFAALRIAPAARLTMLFVGLLPTSLMAASAYGPDGVMIGGSIFVVAAALRFALGEVAHPRRLLAAMAIALACITASKPPYVVLVSLLALIPLELFGTRSTGRRLVSAAAAVSIVPAMIWYRLGQGADSAEIFYPGSDPGEQLANAMRHPFGFLRLVWNTMFVDPYEVFIFRGWVGVYGMARSGRPEVAPLLPMPFIVLAAGVLAAAIVVEGGERRDLTSRVRATRAGVTLGVLVGGPLLVFFSAYVFWTVPGARTIEGVQGRYLLPFVPMVAASIALFRERSTARFSVASVGLASAVLAVASWSKMMDLFY